MVKAVLAVRDHSQASTPARLAVLFALASYSDEDGSNAFPSYTTLMRDARVCRQTVADALREAVANGEIISTGERKRGTKVYSFASFVDWSTEQTGLSDGSDQSTRQAPPVYSADSTGLASRHDQAVPSNDQTKDQNNRLSLNGSSSTSEERQRQKERESLEAELPRLTQQEKERPTCERTRRMREQVEQELQAVA